MANKQAPSATLAPVAEPGMTVESNDRFVVEDNTNAEVEPERPVEVTSTPLTAGFTLEAYA